MTPEEYKKLSEKTSPGTNSLKNLTCAFLIGGAICAAGQGLMELYGYLGLDRDTAGTLCAVTLVFLASLLTGFGVYDDIAKYGGGGTLVPITGFANAVVSPAMEFKSEGFILGVGVKMFTVAGPVIVYGTAASIIYGVILWAVGMM